MSNLIWFDCETTGLDENKDLLLEIAIITTNADLVPISFRETVINQDSNQLEKALNNYTREMHAKNGLLDEVRLGRGADLLELDQQLADAFFSADKDKPKPVLAGNSIHFDRRFINETSSTLRQHASLPHA